MQTSQLRFERKCIRADVTTVTLQTHINEKMPDTEAHSIKMSHVQRVNR